MNRLTSRGTFEFKAYNVKETGIYVKEEDGSESFYSLGEDIYPAIEKLCKLEDLQEQGRLIELPCKIGDKVYVRYMDCPPDFKREYCHDWKHDPDDSCNECPHRVPVPIETSFQYGHIPSFGKIVFLTKEEVLKLEVENEIQEKAGRGASF